MRGQKCCQNRLEETLVYIFAIFSETLKHVAKTVAHVDLTDHVVNIVFTLFDENGKSVLELLQGQ